MNIKSCSFVLLETVILMSQVTWLNANLKQWHLQI